MRRRNREISIFNMSTIDLFACATGAFILLTLILLPYYLNVDRSILGKVAALEEELTDTQSTLAQVEQAQVSCDASLSQTQSELDSLQSELSDVTDSLQQAIVNSQQLQQAVDACGQVEQRSFMLVLMSWQTSDDVDLHVVDPSGERFFYNDRTSAVSVSSFQEDNIGGPGNEIWMHPEATPGEYKVYYNLYVKRTENSVAVRGSIFHQLGKTEIPEVKIAAALGDDHDRAPLVATIVLDETGAISVR